MNRLLQAFEPGGVSKAHRVRSMGRPKIQARHRLLQQQLKEKFDMGRQSRGICLNLLEPKFRLMAKTDMDQLHRR